MRCLNCCVLLVSFVASTGSAHAQGVSGKEFKTKVLAEWKSVLETITTARWEEKIEYYSARDPQLLKLTGVDVFRRAFDRRAGRLSAFDADGIAEDKKATRLDSEVRIINQQYSAELKKSKGTGGWVITDLKRVDRFLPERPGHEDRCAWMIVGNTQLNQWLQESGFVITRIEQIPGQPSGVFSRAYFENHGSPDEAGGYIKSGYIDFDPAHSYRPMSCQYNLKCDDYEGTANFVLEYAIGEGIPVLQVLTVEEGFRSKRKGVFYVKEIRTFSRVEYNGEVPAEPFRLSSYGLPEPQGVVWERTSRWYRWLGSFAGVALVVGGYFGYRVQRRKRMLAQNPISRS